MLSQPFRYSPEFQGYNLNTYTLNTSTTYPWNAANQTTMLMPVPVAVETVPQSEIDKLLADVEGVCALAR